MAPDRFSHREILTAFSGIALAMLMAAMDQTIVATALPTIADGFGGAHMSWVVTAYLLATTATAPIYGRLSDLYGRRRMLQIAVAVFALGSLLCGLAQSMAQLVAFRAVQGLGGGGLMALAFTVIGDMVPPRERGRYQGYISGIFAVASTAGPLLGGLLTEFASWRWIFLINLPLAAAAAAMSQRGLRRLSAGHAEARFDLPGALLLMAAITALMLAVSRIGAAPGWWRAPGLHLAGAAAVVLGTAFVLWQRRAAEPVLPLRLARSAVMRVAMAIVVLSTMVLFAGVVFLPLYLQRVGGVGVSVSGAMMLPLMLGATAGSLVGGRLVSRTGRYKALPVAGLAVATAVLAAFGLAMPGGAPLLALMAVLGAALGQVMPVVTVAVQNAVERRDLGAATAVIGFFRSLGAALGVAAFGALLAGHAPADYGDAFRTMFAAAAGLALAGASVALLLEERPLR